MIKVVSEDNISVCVGTKIGYITAHYDEKGKRNYKLIIGEIKSIKLGKRKQTVEIDGFYLLDLEDVCSDMRIFKEWRAKGIMTVETYFIADEKTIEHVNKWIEWTNTHDPSILNSI